jgi:ketosteroid isomerase-like protein
VKCEGVKFEFQTLLHPFTPRSRRSRCVPFWLAAVFLSNPGTGVAAEPATSSKCASAEHRRLDFWAGDWDAYEIGGGDKPVARARVDIILGGCALREVYEQNDGLVGQSFTTYDASRKLWHQTWVTNRGQLLQIDGRFQGDSLTLQGRRAAPDGHEEILRGVWTAQGGGVRETAQGSTDGGATWQPRFDILFRSHKKGAMAASVVSPPPSDDARTVAALDTEYQAAVKNNDAPTMDRILADDFVLVTGRGQTHTKAALLDEARKKSSLYEHQEELEQKVRVWGDTAVVTALLWLKGTNDGKPFDRKLWFSDTYVRTPKGWKYVFGQASLALPQSP